MRLWEARCPTRLRDLSVTHRVRHHGGSDTPIAILSARRRDRYRVVTSVADVTGVAHALPRDTPDPESPPREDDAAAVPTGGGVRAGPPGPPAGEGPPPAPEPPSPPAAQPPSP